MRSLLFILFSISSLLGCNTINRDLSSSFDSTHPSSIKKKQSNNFFVNGRIMFKNSAGSFSGEMTIQFSKSDFKLNIFAPIIGSLIYSLKANSKKLLVVNFQEKYYLLEDNNEDIRQKWLGMNISLNELKILILGNLPIKKNGWIKKVISKKEYRIFKGSTELVFLLSSNGNIKSMEKFTGGLLEYRAEIPFYKTFKNKDYPRKLIIKDFYSKNEWKIIISEVQKLPYKINPIKLNPPDNMSKFLGY